MKRIGLFLLAVVMVAGLAGCNDHDADPVGRWVEYLDFGCNGNEEMSDIIFIYDNGTIRSDISGIGNWTTDGDEITINYASSVWSGIIEDDEKVAGTFEGVVGKDGCWRARKLEDWEKVIPL